MCDPKSIVENLSFANHIGDAFVTRMLKAGMEIAVGAPAVLLMAYCVPCKLNEFVCEVSGGRKFDAKTYLNLIDPRYTPRGKELMNEASGLCWDHRVGIPAIKFDKNRVMLYGELDLLTIGGINAFRLRRDMFELTLFHKEVDLCIVAELLMRGKDFKVEEEMSTQIVVLPDFEIDKILPVSNKLKIQYSFKFVKECDVNDVKLPKGTPYCDLSEYENFILAVDLPINWGGKQKITHTERLFWRQAHE